MKLRYLHEAWGWKQRGLAKPKVQPPREPTPEEQEQEYQRRQRAITAAHKRDLARRASAETITPVPEGDYERDVAKELLAQQAANKARAARIRAVKASKPLLRFPED